MGEDGFDIGDILQSGIYVKAGSQLRDLVYGTSDGFFFEWLNANGFPAVNYTPHMPLTVRQRYNALKAYEFAVRPLQKAEKEWQEFEQRIQSLEDVRLP